MNIFAGHTLYSQKPIRPPTIAQQITPRSPPRPAAAAITAIAAKSSMDTPVHRPSRPSSRFALLVVPTMTNIISGIYRMPRSSSALRNGILITEPTIGWK